MLHNQHALAPSPGIHLHGDETHTAHVASFMEIVLRRKKTIGLFTIGCGLLAFSLTAPRTKQYRAHTSLEFTGLNDNVLNTRDVDPTATGDNSSQAYINTQARVLESIPLLQRVVDKVKSRVTPAESERRHKALQFLTARTLASDVTIRPGEMSKLIDIYVDSSDPDVASDIANSMTQEYISQITEGRAGSTQLTTGWLSRQMGGARGKLEKSEAALQEYAHKANLVFTSEDGSVAESRLREMQNELSRAQADRVSKEAVYEGVLAEKPEDRGATLRDSALHDYQLKLSDLNRQLADLSTTYQPGYQKVQRLRSQIEEIKKDYDNQHNTALIRLRNEFETAKRREEMIQKAYDTQQALVTRDASAAVDYNILKREVETNRAIYESMLQKVKSYGIVSAIQLSNVRVIDPAETPLFPYKPNVPLMTTFGLMGGFALGLVWVGMRDKGEIHVEYPGQTQMLLQASELGVIPSARLDPFLKAASPRQLAATSGSGKVRLLPDTRVETAMWFCKSSLLAESIRSIRTSLLAKQQLSSDLQTLVVTSLNPGHGKTSLVSNLGIAYAELGKRVLIIDADLRNPGLHRLFGLDNNTGLTTLLCGEEIDDAQIASVVQRTDVPFLSLLSSGPIPAGTYSSSLLHSQHMVATIQQLRASYQTILIDTPPLTLADARILGPIAGGVILVLRAGEVRLDSVLAATERMEQDGSYIVGTVLNNWDPRSNGYGVYPERYHESAYFQMPKS